MLRLNHKELREKILLVGSLLILEVVL
jgi:hypothetical protein